MHSRRWPWRISTPRSTMTSETTSCAWCSRPAIRFSRRRRGSRSPLDQLLTHRGLAALQRAEELRGALGPYALQAAIAACHARARTPEETDWPRIAALYDALAHGARSPVVELNRAVAVAMAFGPAAGLELVDVLTSEPSLKSYHLLPSVRGDFLFKLGRFAEAQAEFERAAALTRNAREHELLLGRARACARGPAPLEQR